MARGKKKEELSLEEKLERALVPVEEQPYEVPGNWCWTKIKYGFDVTSSKRIHKSDWLDNGIPFYRTRELVKLSNNGFVDNELFIANELYSTLIRDFGKPEVGDILVSGVGTIGVPYVVDREEKFYFKDGNVIWFKNKKVFDAKYIFYLYKSLFMKNQIYGMSAGTTVDTYTIVNANETVLPLPPLQEQQRIVERIESLFAKLDEAKEKVQETLEGFEERKAAILHKAFSGKLTEKWRKENKVFKEWETTTIKKCCKIGSGGTPSRQCLEYYHGCIPWIKTGEINWNKIYSAEECISEMGVENSSAKIYEEGAILVAMYGMGVTRGRAAILKTKAATNQAVCVLVPCKDVLNYYLFYYFMCNYWDIRKQAVGGNQLNLSATIIGTFEIGIPSMEEQKEIVRLLDVLLEKENRNKKNVETVLDYIGMIKKSILARAFRGELGTNNPEEESAVELLKTILMET